MENEKKSGRGGYRPGAGRKPGSKDKKPRASKKNPVDADKRSVNRSVTLRADEWEKLEKLAAPLSATRYAADILRAFLVSKEI